MTRESLIAFESTGLPALDAILGGGLPQQSVTVLAGEPGSGKTILTLQILFHAAAQGKKCLYFTTLSEPAVKVIRYMQSFDFFDAELLDKLIIFVDLGTAIRGGAEATLTRIVEQVEKHQPDFMAIDSFRSIAELLRTTGVQRPFVYDLSNQISAWGATTILVGEYAREEFSSFAEFAVADGIIRLGSRKEELCALREIEILKLRGSHYVSGVHFVDIDSTGMAIYPRVRAPDPEAGNLSIADRVSTGVEGLDALLDGGLPRGSATVVQGGTGTGKTILGLNFLLEGARKKERGILFTLEETPNQLRAVAESLGWNLRELEEQQLLQIKYTSPVELSTDRFLDRARTEVRERGAKRVVFDSLSTMALGVASERRFKELAYSVAKHMHGDGVSVLMTMESEQLLGSANLSGLGVSFLADNLIQIRYLEVDGALGRAVSVIKARGVKINSELRMASIDRGGMCVSDERLTDLRGVLTGMPMKG
jgi:circadian clock protein KaiC